MRARERRPWLLIVASLLLAVLSAVLWGKWAESRDRAAQLQAELKQVYSEAEALRTRAARAEQRVMQLERDVAERSAADSSKEPRPATRARR